MAKADLEGRFVFVGVLVEDRKFLHRVAVYKTQMVAVNRGRIERQSP